MADTQEIRLAFIDVTVFSDGSIRGGILTTDIETKPFEFRVTSSIKPTQIQQILALPFLTGILTTKSPGRKYFKVFKANNFVTPCLCGKCL